MNPGAHLLEPLLVMVVLCNLYLLGTGRLSAGVWACAVQGTIVGLFPWLVRGTDARAVAFAAVVVLIKGWLLPLLLKRTIVTTGIRHESRPIIGYSASVALGVAMLAVSVFVAARLPPPPESGRLAASPLVAALAMFTILTGLLLIVARRKALMQVLGYLVLENGVFIIGTSLAIDEPILVEMAVLLDVLAAVFVMGVAIFHISQEFEDIDVDQLTTLRG